MRLSILSFLVLFFLPASFLLAQTEHSYVGAETCGMCHKSEKQGSQLSIWKSSAHSKAFETLKTEKANKIAKEKGFSTPAAETPECLKCHVTGYGQDAKMFGAKFKMEDGIQCETCHGPGSDYKDMKVMKDRDLAIKNGLAVHEKIDDFCITCHNVESPTFVDMDINAAWEKIKHDIPKAK